MRVKISVVIPAYNEEKLIARCLDALVNQNTNKKFEVILVDNNSTDKTVKIAKTFSNKLNLKIIKEKNQGRGAARHRGFKEASGKIILSTDADIYVPSDWIENLSNCLVNSETMAVAGAFIVNDCGLIKNSLVNYFIAPLSARLYWLLVGHYWLGGYNFGIFKEAYKKSGGFSSNLNAGEDVDLGFKVSKIGKIKYVSSIPVVYSSRRFKNQFIRGMLPYPLMFIKYYILKKEQIELSNIR